MHGDEDDRNSLSDSEDLGALISSNDIESTLEPLQPASKGEGLIGEILDPFEGLGAILEEPKLGLALLAIFAVVSVVAMIVVDLWSAVQEAFFSGGPQSLGLK